MDEPVTGDLTRPSPRGAPERSAPGRVPLLNIANVLTMFRIVLVPVFVVTLFVDDGDSTAWRIAATVIFAVAALTDRYDGRLARSGAWSPEFGKLADPIADKALIGAALISLSVLGELSWWVTGVIVVRELGVTALRFWVLKHGVIPASRGGKLKRCSIVGDRFLPPSTGRCLAPDRRGPDGGGGRRDRRDRLRLPLAGDRVAGEGPRRPLTACFRIAQPGTGASAGVCRSRLGSVRRAPREMSHDRTFAGRAARFSADSDYCRRNGARAPDAGSAPNGGAEPIGRCDRYQVGRRTRTVTTRRRECQWRVLLRGAGESLRRVRTDQGRTLREVSTDARVSLGYLSEVERGQKEASSRLLAAICDALDVELADIVLDAGQTLRPAQHDAALSATRWSFRPCRAAWCRARRRGLTGDPEPAVSGDTSERQRCLYPVGAATVGCQG